MFVKAYYMAAGLTLVGAQSTDVISTKYCSSVECSGQESGVDTHSQGWAFCRGCPDDRWSNIKVESFGLTPLASVSFRTDEPLNGKQQVLEGGQSLTFPTTDWRILRQLRNGNGDLIDRIDLSICSQTVTGGPTFNNRAIQDRVRVYLYGMARWKPVAFHKRLFGKDKPVGQGTLRVNLQYKDDKQVSRAWDGEESVGNGMFMSMAIDVMVTGSILPGEAQLSVQCEPGESTCEQTGWFGSMVLACEPASEHELRQIVSHGEQLKALAANAVEYETKQVRWLEQQELKRREQEMKMLKLQEKEALRTRRSSQPVKAH